MTRPRHPLASPTLAAALAIVLAAHAAAQEPTAPSAPTRGDAAAPAAPTSDPAQETAETPDEDEPAEEAPGSPEAASTTNVVPTLTVPGSTNAPGTNAPTRRTRRSSRRSPERSGIPDWRPSSRSGASTANPATNGPAKSDYAYFQLVNDRNIFNPSRVPNRPDRPRSTETRRTPKVESLSLVGTLRYDKGLLAFFDGTSSDFRKALKPGDSIGGHRILSVTDSVVRLVVKDAPVDLKVGHQLRREDEGGWSVAEGVTLATTGSSSSPSSTSSSTTTSSSPSSSSSTPSTAASSGSSGGGAEEILRRLRERRAQETKQ